MPALASMPRWLSALLLGLAAPALIAAEPALHVRDGLPGLAARAATGGPLRVAYFGGSITAAPGWRPLTTAHLQARFPQLALTEIAAGLPGTGSDLGACRFGRDVLRHHPDLLFVEFAVNDASTLPAQIERTMEGIVRQTWQADPHTDICFVYTISTPGLPDLAAGRFPAAAQAMERVAAHYGIPTLHFGVEIARRLAAGSLDFKAPSAPDAERTFTLDGVHPTPAGHRIYAASLAAGLTAMLAAPTPRPALPTPLHPDNWEGATLRLLDAAMRRGDWQAVAPDDPGLRGATRALLPPTWRTAQPGTALEFEFTGATFGLLGIAAPDSGEFRVTVDDLAPVTDTFFDSYVSPTFCRPRPWFYPGPLTDGPHRVRVELLDTVIDKAGIKAQAGRPLTDPADYTAHRLTLSGVLLVASPRP